MQRFVKEKYFTAGSDLKYGDFEQPTMLGQELITKYYAEKYQANIENHPLETTIDMSTFVRERYKKLKENKENDLRIVYIRTSPEHSQPITYLQENGKEAFLIADSVADKSFEANQIGAELQIPVFLVKIPRQRDSHSCHVDAYIWAREITAKNADGKYSLPGLLDFLSKHSHLIPNRHYFVVDSLPSRLLITAQESEFVKTYSIEANDTIVRGGLNLEKFLEKHKRDITYKTLHEGIFKEKKSNASVYTTKKSLKLVHVAEIQFYADQLKQILGKQWAEVKIQYYAEAKACVKSKPPKTLLEFAAEFLAKLRNKIQSQP